MLWVTGSNPFAIDYRPEELDLREASARPIGGLARMRSRTVRLMARKRRVGRLAWLPGV